ncbi:sodium:calcium antiporter [Actinomadura craniellae]|nr:sodium:calcium antiporter [Actinomadura craniellae]
MLFFLLGASILVMAADQLVLGSGRLAERLGIAPVVVGVVVLGFGTSTPELLVTATAAIRGEGGLAAAGLAGANMINLTLVLGVCGLAGPLAVRSAVLRREAPFAVAAVALFAVVLLRGPDPLGGAVCAVGLVLLVAALVRTARSAPDDPIAVETSTVLADGSAHSLARESARAAAGLAGLLLGAGLLVTGATDLATLAGVPQAFIGFTLVALGTTLPELVTSLHAARRAETDLLIGNLLGSDAFNSLAGGAVLGAFSTGVRVPVLMVLAMAAVTPVAWGLLARGGGLTRPEAGLLVALYLVLLPVLS